jgi:hypothetical protein
MVTGLGMPLSGSRRLAAVAGVGALLLCVACSRLEARRLRGVWESEALPKRTLELKPDGTFARRLSGKTLGFLSDLVGAETGSWLVEDHSLVLRRTESNKEISERLAIKDLSGGSVFLGGERWNRLP